jgi:hypothetical protein
MMQDKIYLLLVVLLLVVVRTLSIDSYNRKGSSALSRKTYADTDDDVDYADKEKHDHVDVDSSQPSTYRRNRYPQTSSLSNNYRSRSRWPSPYDDSYDTNDASSYGYGPLNGAYSNNGPGCYSLLDSQSPLFSDICGAVPQARYALPNAFGHLERWQIAQTLTAILGPLTPTSANPGCNRSLRLLVCPLLFPSCPTRYETLPVLPCQSFCRAVKSHCAAPTLDLLPCDFLPPRSELCPVNPTPFSSLLSSFIQPSPLAGGLSPFQQSALSSMLAQSAFPSALSPLDVSSLAFPSFMPPSIYSQTLTPLDLSPSVPPAPYPSAPIPAGAPSSPLPTSVPPAPYPSGPTPSSVPPSPVPTSNPPAPYSPTPTPSAIPSPTFSPFLPPPGFSPFLPFSGGPPPAFSPFSPFSGGPPPGFSPLSPFSGGPPPGFSPLLPPLPMNPLFNAETYMADSLTPILVDFPPLQYAKNYRQASRFFPVTRSATEKV